MAKQYEARPAMALHSDKLYRATIQMARGGSFTVELFPKAAPETVNSFVFLAQEGFFNGVTFHRVVPGFVAQAGNPTGSGGPGYQLPDEVNDLKHRAGVLAMAKAAESNSAGSQFYITLAPQAHLDGKYTVFGKVRDGMDTVHAIAPREPGPGVAPGDAIEYVTITSE